MFFCFHLIIDHILFLYRLSISKEGRERKSSMTRGLSGHMNVNSSNPGDSPSTRKKNQDTPSHMQQSVSSRRENQASNAASKKVEESNPNANQSSISATLRSKLGSANKSK
jgi:hypothetical protein